MTQADASLIAAVHRLATADRRACARVSRLLAIGALEAQALIGMCNGGRLTTRSLQRELGLSAGGAIAFRRRLEHERLVRCEPDPDRPGEVRLRLADGARLELEAALAGFAAQLTSVATDLTARERAAIVAWLSESHGHTHELS